MNELMVQNQYNEYPEVISYDEKNPTLRSPYSPIDLQFYQTRESLQDMDTFRNFLRNVETRFRSSRDYKAYKAYLIENIGLNRCQIFGNITMDDADIELHHNVLGLFDICLLIALHIVNTVGIISTFDLIQLVTIEHMNNNVGVTFLTKTAHQIYTNDSDGYIPPEMTFGKWWVLLNKYRYGITYDIAQKVINYIRNYQERAPVSINLQQQEQILSFAAFNEYGTPPQECGFVVGDINEDGGYEEYGF